ncbi:MAG: thioredoxin-disulfide reductase [Halanaerobium sp.]|nr:thioredoxin-disulfide reductase [Halanaerobium sp.]
MADKYNEDYDVIIIGSGIAGWTAGTYTARGGLKTLLLGGPQPGGQLTTTPEVENFPGFPDGVNGVELVERAQNQAQKFGAELTFEVVEEIKPGAALEVQTDNANYRVPAVIVATGARPRQLGLAKEDALRGRGVSYCATCDGFFYRQQKVAVVGGGNTALEEALFLTKFVEKVYLIHRRDALRGAKILQDRVFENDKIEVIWDSVVKEIEDSEGKNLSGIRLFNKTTEEESFLEIAGLFIAIGQVPESEPFKGLLEMDEQGYIITDQRQRTNIAGIYAAGDVQDSHYRQAVIAAGSAAKAAMEVERYLLER